MFAAKLQVKGISNLERVIARSKATKQSREGYEIATPRQDGARNDKKRCT